jgi:hypothetical protein
VPCQLLLTCLHPDNVVSPLCFSIQIRRTVNKRGHCNFSRSDNLTWFPFIHTDESSIERESTAYCSVISPFLHLLSPQPTLLALSHYPKWVFSFITYWVSPSSNPCTVFPHCPKLPLLYERVLSSSTSGY